jgi:carbon monoxide dehydrogenase subunit G
MRISGQFTINAPAKKVWDILATNFEQVGDWASSISHSACNTALAAGEQGRVCHTDFGIVEETITQFDVQNGIYAYRTEKPLFFIRKASNQVHVQADGIEATRLEMQAEVDLLPILGWLMRPLIAEQLHTMMNRFVEELRNYAETGNVHPRKVRAQTKHPLRNQARYGS